MGSLIGVKIKELRLLSNMSQEELGRRVGLQRAAINKYEKGSVTNIPLPTVEKIASVFDVSPAYLVGWNNKTDTTLAFEARVLQGVQYFYGAKAVDLLETYTNLSEVGKKRLMEYASDLDHVYHATEEEDL